MHRFHPVRLWKVCSTLIYLFAFGFVCFRQSYRKDICFKLYYAILGTQTSVSGKFSLSVPPNSTLVFTFTGYLAAEKAVPAVGAVDVQMEANNKQLGEVVVTGTLGRKSEEKAVGYAQTHLTANDVN